MSITPPNYKKFELMLTVRNPEKGFEFKSSDRIQGDTMVELLAQLQIAIAIIMEKELDELRLKQQYPNTINDDDIPF